VSITLTFIKNNMFEKILTRIVIFIFAWLILWGAFGTKAKANEIYIDQVGNNVNIDIVQKGENNQIKGRTTTNAPISGNNNTLNINQGYKGNNLIQMTVDGNSNSVLIGQEKVYSGGTFSNDTNSYGHHSASVEISGDGNNVEIIQRNNNNSSAGHTSNVRFRGDNNSISTLQTGTGGANGHLSWVYTHDTESNNTVDIFQNSDTADHKAYVSLYTDGNTVDIDQTGTSQNKAYVLFSSNASGPTDFTLSQNGGDTYGNPDTSSYVTISCGSAAGCTLNVSQ